MRCPWDSNISGSTLQARESCKIAATWAKDGGQGCSTTRDPAPIAPTTTALKAKNADPGTAGEFLVVRSEGYGRDVRSAPLNRRGRVIQERYLAPRQINFAEDRVSWECHELVATEQFPNGLRGPRTATDHVEARQNSKPRLDYHGEHDLRRAWSHLVRKYSSCELTHYTDKMIAIFGLAHEFQERVIRIRPMTATNLWQRPLAMQQILTPPRTPSLFPRWMPRSWDHFRIPSAGMLTSTLILRVSR